MTTSSFRLVVILTALTGLSSCATKQAAYFQPSATQRYYSPPSVTPPEPVFAAEPTAEAAPALMASANAAVPPTEPPKPVSVQRFEEMPRSGQTPVAAPTDAPKTSTLTRKESRQQLRALVKAARVQAHVAPKDGGMNGLAVAALVCGIVGLFVLPFVLGTLAVIFGAVALSQISQRGERGRGNAIAGLILGIISLIYLLVVLASR